MIQALVRALSPGTTEIRRLARAETDPAAFSRFQPITRGPIVALLLLAGVGLAALLWLPFRVLGAPARRARDTRDAGGGE